MAPSGRTRRQPPPTAPPAASDFGSVPLLVAAVLPLLLLLAAALLGCCTARCCAAARACGVSATALLLQYLCLFTLLVCFVGDLWLWHTYKGDRCGTLYASDVRHPIPREKVTDLATSLSLPCPAHHPPGFTPNRVKASTHSLLAALEPACSAKTVPSPIASFICGQASSTALHHWHQRQH